MPRITIVALVCMFAVPIGAWADSVRLSRGTPVYIETVEPLSSETARSGAPIVFRVAFDVRSGGVVVVERGAPASGVLEEVHATGIVGKAGSLLIRPLRCSAADGSSVLLEGEHHIKGAEYVEESAAVAGMVCCLGIFLRGKKAAAKERTVVAAIVSNDVEIALPVATHQE